MRRLMLLRHAQTERAEPGGRDRDRTLTARGRTDAPRLGAYMARHGLVPELALVSAASRAQQTWALIASAFATPPPVLVDERIYQAGPDALIDTIRASKDVPSLLVVGHNPGLHELAVLLVATGEAEARRRLAEGLPTCALAVIDLALTDWERLHPQSGRLERLVSPRALAAAPD
jgi:phosphohistidine phosphatase